MSIQFGPEYVRAIAPYQGGKPIAEVAREFGLDEAKIVKLASNENPLGMPESARLAMLAAGDAPGNHPDARTFGLYRGLNPPNAGAHESLNLRHRRREIP